MDAQTLTIKCSFVSYVILVVFGQFLIYLNTDLFVPRLLCGGWQVLSWKRQSVFCRRSSHSSSRRNGQYAARVERGEVFIDRRTLPA